MPITKRFKGRIVKSVKKVEVPGGSKLRVKLLNDDLSITIAMLPEKEYVSGLSVTYEPRKECSATSESENNE